MGDSNNNEERKRAAEFTKASNVIKSLGIKCHRSTLKDLQKRDRAKYEKMVKKCKPLKTKLDSSLKVDQVFYHDNEAGQYRCVSELAGCHIRRIDPICGPLYENPGSVDDAGNKSIGAYYVHQQKSLNENEYQTINEYAKQKESKLKLLIVRDAQLDKQQALELLSETRDEVCKLIAVVKNTPAMATKPKKTSKKEHKKSPKKVKQEKKKKKKKDKKAKKEKKEKKSKKKKHHKKRKRVASNSDDESETLGSESEEDESDDDASYEPESDDDDDSGKSRSSESSDGDEEDEEASDSDDESSG